MHRTLLQVFIVAVLATCAAMPLKAHASDDASVPASVDPSAAPDPQGALEQRASVPQVEMLVSFQRSLYGASANVNSDQSLKACVALNMSKVAPGNSAWNSSDPRWGKMSALIEKDCAAHIAMLRRSLPLIETTARKSLERDYAARLSRSEAQALIDYYKSAQGQRFVAFQAALAPIAQKGAAALMSRQVSENRPPPDIVKARMESLRLATAYEMLVVANDDARRDGRDTSGFAALGIIVMSSAMGADATLDQLDEKYAADMPGFKSFIASEPEQQEQRVFLDVAKATSQLVLAQARTLDPTFDGSIGRWRQAYEAMPQ